MRIAKIWLDITVTTTVLSCVLALIIGVLGVFAGAIDGSLAMRSPQTAGSSDERAYEGMITCSKCGAKHSPKVDQAASDCVRVCVHGGASFVLVNADSTYFLDGRISDLKKLAGQRARVVGTMTGKTIKVESAAAA